MYPQIHASLRQLLLSLDVSDLQAIIDPSVLAKRNEGLETGALPPEAIIPLSKDSILERFTALGVASVKKMATTAQDAITALNTPTTSTSTQPADALLKDTENPFLKLKGQESVVSGQ